MSEYPTSSAVQDLATRVDALTFETSGVGHQIGRIADFLTGQNTGFGPQGTAAPNSVQSQSGSEPVDPEEPSPPPPTVAMVDSLLQQVKIDYDASEYWRGRRADLSAVESYLNSLKDHLS